ncbi:MAG: calcium/sodium antiporter [bacterium]
MDLAQWPTFWLSALFSLGLTLLFAGGHALVHGSSRLARILGIHPIVVGLTIVALGTSMPEFLVSMVAALKNKADIALGNIVGSNIANIGLILGISALARPIEVHLKLLKFEVPLVVGVSTYFWIICLNGTLSRIDGITLAIGFVIYLIVVIKGAKKNSHVLEKKYNPIENETKSMAINTILILLGIIGLTYGAKWTVEAASEFSRRLGVSELILGLTVVALGTSLPELATSVVAAVKKEGDISIGNIFNMMAIAGPTAAVHPLQVSKELIFEKLPAMLVLTIILWPMLGTGRKLGRVQGSFLLLGYIALMMWWLIKL